MALEYKKRLKESYGHPAVVMTDVLSVSRTIGSGVVGAIALGTDADNSGVYVSSFVMPKDGILKSVVCNVSPALTEGNVSYALYKNSVLQSSGTLTSATPSVHAQFFESAKGAERTVASGDALLMTYAVGSALSVAGQVNRGINVRVGVEYRV